MTPPPATVFIKSSTGKPDPAMTKSEDGIGWLLIEMRIWTWVSWITVLTVLIFVLALAIIMFQK